MTDTAPEQDPVEPPTGAKPGDGRSVKEPVGEDPRDTDQLHDAETAARLTYERHVTHAQPTQGDSGISSDSPGHNPADRDQLDD